MPITIPKDNTFQRKNHVLQLCQIIFCFPSCPINVIERRTIYTADILGAFLQSD